MAERDSLDPLGELFIIPFGLFVLIAVSSADLWFKLVVLLPLALVGGYLFAFHNTG